MNTRNPIASLQKIYDDAHLICSTAIYFESLSNESEALRYWRNALTQLIHEQYVQRIPLGYVPRSEVERQLVESLRKLEGQCRERVELLETLEKSRRESGEANAGFPEAGFEDGFAGGTIAPMGSADLAKPPPLPTRPLPLSREISGESVASSSGVASPRKKSSRETSPEKKGRMKTSLRPGASRNTTKSPVSGHSSSAALQAPAAAGRAATQAWVSKRSRAHVSGRTSRAEVENVQQRVQRLDVGSNGSGKLRNTRIQEDENPFLDDGDLQLTTSKSGGHSSGESAYRSSYSRANGSRRPNSSLDDAVAASSRLRRGNHKPLPDTPILASSAQLYASEDGTKQVITNPLTNQKITSNTVTRKPVHKSRRYDHALTTASAEAEEELLEHSDASSDTQEDEDNLEPDPPPSREEAWRAFVSSLLENLPRGIDRAAAEQILNEVIIQGDPVRWTDIAGLDPAKAALKENVVYPFLRPDLFLGLREPARGMLLFGPPGTGKTMLARAVATEAKSTFFAISASSLLAKFMGESEKLVRALFGMAKILAPSIIFVDEIDSLLSSRSGDGEHEASRRVKTEFLIQWSDLARAAQGNKDASVGGAVAGDASRVLVLAATNAPWSIDDAARRRFVRRQYIPLPEGPVRATQLRTLMKYQKHGLGDADMEKLVELTEGFSGSDITALAKDAAMGPLRSLGDQLLMTTTEDIRPIGMQDFEASLQTIRPSVSKQGLEKFEEWAKEFGERGG